MIQLFTPFESRSVRIKNRIMMSPMCMYSAQDGFANDFHLMHLGARAAGGVGLVMVEATAVHPSGRISPGDLGIWSDDHIGPLSKITALIKSFGCVPGIQIAHAGRNASCHVPWEGGKALTSEEQAWTVFGPTEQPYSEEYAIPKAMSAQDIQNTVDDFAKAAQRALKAGFEVIEIHAAHGYLIHTFLSPISNSRTDDYGGSFENRTKLLKEIVDAVKGQWPDHLPLWTRLSCTDWIEGGWTPEDSVRLAKALKPQVDLIDCSSAGLDPRQQVKAQPMFQSPFAAKIKREADIPTVAVGWITTPEEANMLVTEEKADLIALGRPLLRQPFWALEAAKALGQKPEWIHQYGRVLR